MRDVGKGAAVYKRRVVLQSLHKVRLHRVFEQHGHWARRENRIRTDRLAIAGVANHDAAQTRLQIIHIRGQAENGHHFRGNGNIEAILAAEGLNMGDIVKCMVFLTDMDRFGEMNAVYADAFDDAAPARSAYQVVRLPKDALVEIEAIAVEREH